MPGRTKKADAKAVQPDRRPDELIEERARLRLKADEVRQQSKELASAICAAAACQEINQQEREE